MREAADTGAGADRAEFATKADLAGFATKADLHRAINALRSEMR